MKKKLGEILVNTGAVSGADVEAALTEQSAGEPSRLGELLVASGKLSSEQLAQALSEQYQLPYVELPRLPQAVLDLVPMDLQRQFRFVPLRSDGTELHIAMADMGNIEVLAVLEQQWTKVHVHVASGDEIDALHATLSGLFAAPVEELPPSQAAGPTVDELFGSFELEAPTLEANLPPAADVPSVSPSSVMRIAASVSASPVPQVAPSIAPAPAPSPVPPVAPVSSPAPHAATPHLAEDLFGDLNLESVRTGIPARPPEDVAAVPATPPEPVRVVTAPLGLPTSSISYVGEAPPATASPPPPSVHADGAAPAVIEGTGPLLDLLVREGTGPVVDTPFFEDALSGPLVPPMSDAPFVSSRSAIGAPALQPVEPPAADAPPVEGVDAALPDWLQSDASGSAAAPAPVEVAPSAPLSALPPQPWTGALDHLMPSKLVVGLTRALLARGLVTEAEILAALGQKK